MEEKILSLSPKKILKKARHSKSKSDVKSTQAPANRITIPNNSIIINPLLETQNDFEPIIRANQQFKQHFKQTIQQPIIQPTPNPSFKPKPVAFIPTPQIRSKTLEDLSKLKALEEILRTKARIQIEEQIKNKLKNTPKPLPSPQPFTQPKLVIPLLKPKPMPPKKQRSYDYENDITKVHVNELSNK